MSSNIFTSMGTAWFTLASGERILMNDITKFANVIDTYRNDPYMSMSYTIQQGDRMDTISYKLYDTVDYWWTIPFFNGMHDMNISWPMSDATLNQYIRDKYPLNLFNDVHHYETPDGFTTDIMALSLAHGIPEQDVIGTFGLYPVSIFDHEYAVNEAKRHIRLIDPGHIKAVVDKIISALGG